MGTFHGMRACLEYAGLGNSFNGKTVAIQGAGNVGRNLCQILTEAGAVIKIADINQRNVDYVVQNYGCQQIAVDEILTTECDVLAPCALGGIINASHTKNLKCPIICGAANNILGDPIEDSVALKNAGIIYGPDFVVNAGGLIHLAGLHLGISPEILKAKNDEIFDTTQEILNCGETAASTYAAAVEIAEHRLKGAQETEVHAS